MSNSVVLITGASSGIGKAAAHLFAAKGWQVAATMRNPAAETELAAVPNVKIYALDVTDATSVTAAVAAVQADFGRIDVLVNNAGYGLVGPLETADEPTIMRQFQTNVFGVMRTIQAVTPLMRTQGHGVIINITSIGGLITLPFNSLYHAAKFAVDGLSESLNYELRPFGITVKVVAPGGVKTDFASRSLALTTTPGVPTIYDDAIAKVWAAFSTRMENQSTGEQIAEVIFQAATDGTGQIRYVAGPDAQQMYAGWKAMSNEDFFAMMNGNFGL
jgi:NAD(P)-dependent dehydrogenase (short-subunit alcohol dehydrogenase family)